jgi:hypothetical protein
MSTLDPGTTGRKSDQKIYLRKRQVARRYGDVTLRSIERAVEDGRLPPPIYPCGENTPMWDLAVLEENERAAALRSKPHQVEREDSAA